ncbi:hypothetical protein PT974_11223 [Cladobotryum mycophilum]|uniref:SPX domain-containing protein n=1 Tax=Cladobotryum mycophilum TaxID=491253 RepID=A0ABR0S5Q1_9HYPO
MKYGNQLERESVPEWSLHNLDYNSLKHEIKVHTTRDQATAIAIPGHQDTALRKFEDGLYNELCRQHDRVDLFVTSKADEVFRRLEHIETSLQRWIYKNCDEPDCPSASLKRQRRFVKFERELLRCNEDIHALSRFANAQVIAIRKILKKYRKWTGSTTLTARFNDAVLSNPKSFTKRSFNDLQERHDDVQQKLQSATPQFSEPGSPSSMEMPLPDPIRFPRSPRVSFDPLPPSTLGAQVQYWNEYDNGSEGGGPDDDYTLYIDPNEDMTFPGLSYIIYPFARAREWFRPRSSEHQPLYIPEPHMRGYGAISSAHMDSDEEGGYASSDGFPSQGYASHFALPSLTDQSLRRYRERVLMFGTLWCFLASFVFLGIAGVLISTGKHKLRVEVDAGATVGAVVSLFCACSALGMMVYREDDLSISYRLMVWSTFIATCVLNGMLLVLILGNSP